MQDISYFERLKLDMQIGDIEYYGNDDEAKDKLAEKINDGIRLGYLDENQANELHSLIDYSINVAKERRSKNLDDLPKESYPNLPDFVSNPVTLEDRRSRANYWRLNNSFQIVMDTVTRKNHKFQLLWQEYGLTNDEQRREEIVKEMEKMYPTTTQKLRQANEREGKTRK